MRLSVREQEIVKEGLPDQRRLQVLRLRVPPKRKSQAINDKDS
jgi:hypothetical protein